MLKETPNTKSSSDDIVSAFIIFCFNQHTGYLHFMYNAQKGPLCNLWTTQALISLHISAGWSGPSLSAYRIGGNCSICWWTENAQARLHRCTLWSGPTLSGKCMCPFHALHIIWFTHICANDGVVLFRKHSSSILCTLLSVMVVRTVQSLMAHQYIYSLHQQG